VVASLNAPKGKKRQHGRGEEAMPMAEGAENRQAEMPVLASIRGEEGAHWANGRGRRGHGDAYA